MTDLTEQMHKGELPYAEYYIKLAGGEYTNDVWDIGGWQSFNKKGDVVVKVLAPVPPYEVYKELIDGRKLLREYIKDITNENAQLKEQINKCCLDAINRGTANAVKAVKEFGMPERIEELVEENTQLKELLRIILSKTETCYSMVFQKDIITAELNKTLLKKIDEVLK